MKFKAHFHKDRFTPSTPIPHSITSPYPKLVMEIKKPEQSLWQQGRTMIARRTLLVLVLILICSLCHGSLNAEEKPSEFGSRLELQHGLIGILYDLKQNANPSAHERGHGGLLGDPGRIFVQRME
ncbi:MAG: hypothetical protein HC888_01135 [Candidatus Competibacteraceae bacterium]|nr:hypothetical protein [Candidatus Competibacteraceae bacterium]